MKIEIKTIDNAWLVTCDFPRVCWATNDIDQLLDKVREMTTTQE